MTWYMVYWKEIGTEPDGTPHAAGQAYSCGSIIADPMPDQFGVVVIGDEQPDFSKTQWNPLSLALESIPGS